MDQVNGISPVRFRLTLQIFECAICNWHFYYMQYFVLCVTSKYLKIEIKPIICVYLAWDKEAGCMLEAKLIKKIVSRPVGNSTNLFNLSGDWLPASVNTNHKTFFLFGFASYGDHVKLALGTITCAVRKQRTGDFIRFALFSVAFFQMGLIDWLTIWCHDLACVVFGGLCVHRSRNILRTHRWFCIAIWVKRPVWGLW